MCGKGGVHGCEGGMCGECVVKEGVHGEGGPAL